MIFSKLIGWSFVKRNKERRRRKRTRFPLWKEQAFRRGKQVVSAGKIVIYCVRI